MSITPEEVDDNPKSYGSRGQSWNPAFVEYMKSIVLHPNFDGMPDAVKPDGKIQWEAPSNRSDGAYQNTHHHRREWWRAKATEVGVELRGEWISRVAKKIHPTGLKPCKRCGRSLRIAYAYPSAHLIRRATSIFGVEMVPDKLEEIGAYVDRLVDQLGTEALDRMPELLRTGDVQPPDLGRDLDAWQVWIEDTYISTEPSLLSPGAMSNAPDRFDGFHSFNRCCRGHADSGRHAEKLRSYTTDRRVFEYWSEGDWIAADRMMGLVRARFMDHACADGGNSATADHIGPLSLGFLHRPEFRLLSKAANSAKNNRMTMWDVDFLVRREADGIRVASWYAEPIWNALKANVLDDETALRLSKIMRDNQRSAMMALARFFESGHVTFLATLLNLHFADSMVEFVNPVITDFITTFDSVSRVPRSTRYASEQKARRVRVGFEALRAYAARSNRHLMTVEDPAFDLELERALAALRNAPQEILEMNERLLSTLQGGSEGAQEEELRSLSAAIPALAEVPVFVGAMRHLEAAMEVAARNLAPLWNDNRYVRAEFSFD